MCGWIGNGILAASPMFRKGLSEAGFSDGHNVTIEYRWAENQPSRLPVLAAELVDRKVALIVATGGSVSALAAKAATSTIPIVFTTGAEPVAVRLVASLNRPGGHATGVAFLATALATKRLEIMSDLAPKASNIGLLVNPNNASAAAEISDVEAAARAMGKQAVMLRASTEREIEMASAALVRQPVQGLLIAADTIFRRPAQPDCGTGRTASGAGDLLFPPVCRGRRTVELRQQHH